MAFRDFAKGENTLPKHRDNVFYNVDGTVGPTATPESITFNQKDDIMLVQFFLKKIADNPQVFSRPFHPPKTHPVMKIDGKFGGITQTWIEKFQNHLHNIGRPVRRDGYISRVRRGVATSENGFVYTHFMLNVAFGQIVGDAGWDTWWKEDVEVPSLLRDAVRAPETFL